MDRQLLTSQCEQYLLDEDVKPSQLSDEDICSAYSVCMKKFNNRNVHPDKCPKWLIAAVRETYWKRFAHAEPNIEKMVGERLKPIVDLFIKGLRKVAAEETEQLKMHLRNQLQAEFNQYAIQSGHPQAVITEEPIKRRTRILIIGLIGPQVNALCNKSDVPYNEHFDLRFHGSDQGLPSIDKIKEADRVMVMTKFISHSHFDKVKKHAKQFSYVNGSTSQVRIALDAIMAEEGIIQ